MPTVTAADNLPPPGNWDREVPRYKVTRDLHPSPNSRHRHETPFTSMDDNSCWQQSDREYAAGSIVESRNWPHSSMTPLNESAERVLQFFKSRIKSRLPRTPFRGDRIVLDDGLTGPTPNIAMNSGVTECPTS
jgi:hypothetical protein